jgi:putative cytotoxic protein
VTNKPPPRSGFVASLQRISWNGEVRWRDDVGRIYTWDRLHGEFEVYTPTGRHVGVLGEEGQFLKPAVKGRCIDV